MKIVASVFIFLGIITNFAYSILLGIIGLVVGTLTLCSLRENKKLIYLGILSILFTGVLGGVFYLLWDPQAKE